jgi:hypothetical protein
LRATVATVAIIAMTTRPLQSHHLARKRPLHEPQDPRDVGARLRATVATVAMTTRPLKSHHLARKRPLHEPQDPRDVGARLRATQQAMPWHRTRAPAFPRRKTPGHNLLHKPTKDTLGAHSGRIAFAEPHAAMPVSAAGLIHPSVAN